MSEAVHKSRYITPSSGMKSILYPWGYVQ